MYSYHSYFTPHQYSPKSLRKHLKAGWFDTAHWRSITDISFTVKNCGSPNAREVYEENFSVFIHYLNRYVFKNAASRYGKRLRVVGVIEKSVDGRWNIHCAIEPPQYLSHEELTRLIRKAWLKTRFGDEQMLVRPSANSNWIDYMLKLRQKSGLESWSDCILCTHHNPIADTKSSRGVARSF